MCAGNQQNHKDIGSWSVAAGLQAAPLDAVRKYLEEADIDSQ